MNQHWFASEVVLAMCRTRLGEAADRQIAHGAMHLSLRLGGRGRRVDIKPAPYHAQDRYRGDSRPGSRGYHRPSYGFAEAEATPARIDRAINTEAIVFMARTPYERSGQHLVDRNRLERISAPANLPLCCRAQLGFSLADIRFATDRGCSP